MVVISAQKYAQGEMLEWLKRHAWKACKLQKGFRGSNPRLSAKILHQAREVSLLADSDRCKSFEQGANGSLWDSGELRSKAEFESPKKMSLHRRKL